MADFVRSMAIESWTLYAVGMLLILSRIVSRRMKLGSLRNLQIEDLLMLVAGATFTGFVVSVNEVAKNGSSYMAPEVAAALSPEEAAMAVYGSKMTLVLEMCTLSTVWLVKSCLLLLYYRLTREAFHWQHLAVKLIAAYCVISYVLIVVLCLTYWCRPIYEYWRVPVKYSQCATYYNHMIFATSFNISSDLMLLLIPLPIIIKTHLPLKRKIVLSCVLGLGVFNIIAAVLNRYYNFNNPNDLGYVYWYVGEVAISVCVGNIPLCWPLIRQVFNADSWFDSKEAGGGDTPPQHLRPGPFRRRRRPKTHSSLWLSTWGAQTAWDKVDDAEDQGGGGGGGDDDDARRMAGLTLTGAESQGSEIELTPGWHGRANSTSINADGTKGADAGSGNNDAGNTVMVVKTVHVSRG